MADLPPRGALPGVAQVTLLVVRQPARSPEHAIPPRDLVFIRVERVLFAREALAERVGEAGEGLGVWSHHAQPHRGNGRGPTLGDCPPGYRNHGYGIVTEWRRNLRHHVLTRFRTPG